MAAPSSWRGVASPGPGAGVGVGAGGGGKGPVKDVFPIDDKESVISDYGVLLEKGEESEEDDKDDGGSESDSSIDIHTPLP